MKAKKVLVDSGFYSEEAIGRVEADGKVEVLAAVEKSHHGMTVDDLEKKQEPREPAADAPMKEKTVQSALCRRGLAFGHGIERGQMLIGRLPEGVLPQAPALNILPDQVDDCETGFKT